MSLWVEASALTTWASVQSRSVIRCAAVTIRRDGGRTPGTASPPATGLGSLNESAGDDGGHGGVVRVVFDGLVGLAQERYRCCAGECREPADRERDSWR